MNIEKYNGWANYPTWVTYFWLTNDCADERKLAKAAYTWKLCEYTENVISQTTSIGLAYDLIHWTLDLVDWAELRKAVLRYEELELEIRIKYRKTDGHYDTWVGEHYLGSFDTYVRAQSEVESELEAEYGL